MMLTWVRSRFHSSWLCFLDKGNPLTTRTAIWDNRCTYHAPTPDAVGSRDGWRVVSMGERPYLDPNSMSRNEAALQKTSKAATKDDREAKIVNGVSDSDELEFKRRELELTNGVHPEAKGSKRPIDVIDGHQTLAC